MIKLNILKVGIPLRINNDSYEIKERYLVYFKKHNIIPILITPENESLIIECDFIAFIGGVDINPHRYNKDIYANFNDKLDEFEFHILDLTIALHLPILGICRGIQLLNVYFGGTLKNINKHLNSLHLLYCQDNNFQIKKHQVNSYHHQAIDELADNFVPFLYSEDNIIEGIIDKKKRIIATQYHIEIDDPFNIIDYLITLLSNDINQDTHLPISTNR